jgi:hypothetical protein
MAAAQLKWHRSLGRIGLSHPQAAAFHILCNIAYGLQ